MTIFFLVLPKWVALKRKAQTELERWLAKYHCHKSEAKKMPTPRAAKRSQRKMTDLSGWICRPMMGEQSTMNQTAARSACSIRFMGLHLLDLMLAENAVRSENEDEDEQAEGKHVLVVACHVACGKGFGKAQGEAAKNCSGN